MPIVLIASLDDPYIYFVASRFCIWIGHTSQQKAPARAGAFCNEIRRRRKKSTFGGWNRFAMKSAFRQEKAADFISSEAAHRRFHPSLPGFHHAKHDFISISPQSQNCRQIWTTTLRPLPKTRTILKRCFYSLDRFELPHQFGSASNSKYEKLISSNGQIRTTENQILTYWRQIC